MKKLIASAIAATALSACSPATAPASEPAAAAETSPADLEVARAAHEAYVAAINTNDVTKVMDMLTDDIVYQAPHGPEVVGKEAVRQWVQGYMDAYSTVWEKTSLEFVLAGEWAFERYAYKSVDTPRAGGAPVEDVGKGINIYHHDADGKWRVARDGWSTDLPLPTN